MTLVLVSSRSHLATRKICICAKIWLLPQFLELFQFKTIDCTSVLHLHAPLIQRVMTLILGITSWNPFTDLTQQLELVFTTGTCAIVVHNIVFSPLLCPRLYFHYNLAQDLYFLPQFLEASSSNSKPPTVSIIRILSVFHGLGFENLNISWSSERTKAPRGFQFACVLYMFGQLVCSSGKRQVLPHAISFILNPSHQRLGGILWIFIQWNIFSCCQLYFCAEIVAIPSTLFQPSWYHQLVQKYPSHFSNSGSKLCMLIVHQVSA